MLIVVAGSGFRVKDGPKLNRRGGIGALKQRYGKRLKPIRDRRTLNTYYRYRGSSALTDFNTDRFNSKGRILTVLILAT